VFITLRLHHHVAQLVITRSLAQAIEDLEKYIYAHLKNDNTIKKPHVLLLFCTQADKDEQMANPITQA
jgi:hypothetical protein